MSVKTKIAIYVLKSYLSLYSIEYVCFKLYLLIPENKMIEIYMPMFIISLLNFILGYKMFMVIGKIS